MVLLGALIAQSSTLAAPSAGPVAASPPAGERAAGGELSGARDHA